MLNLIVDQVALTSEQLTGLSGVPERELAAMLDRLVAARLVGREPVLVGVSPWVWARSSGAAATGRGFDGYRPSIRSLGHIWSINQARLELKERAPEAVWIGERELRRRAGGRVSDVLPDAEVQTAGERHAIEVEVSVKRAGEAQEKIARLEEGFDGVVYLAAPKVARRLARLDLPRCHPKLVVRELETLPRSLAWPGWRVAGDKGVREPSVELALGEADRDLLDLLAEQGGVPMDQLRRFAGCGAAECEERVARLVSAGLVRRARPLHGEPPWAWLLRGGMAASRHDLDVAPPLVGGLALLRARNEVRLQVCGSGGRWVSGRLLRRQHGCRGAVPAAEVRIGAERHAIDVWEARPDQAALERRLAEWLRRYDLVVWFYSRRASALVEGLALRHGEERLVVRPLPGADMSGLRYGRRQAGGGRSGAPSELWRRLRRRPAVAMERVSLVSVPAEAEAALAACLGAEHSPPVLEAWRARRGGPPLYRLWTEQGAFRVVRSRYGWRADAVECEGVFILLPAPAREAVGGPGSGERRRVRAQLPERAELSDREWAAVAALVPERRPSPRGGAPLGGRRLVNGLVWMLRNGATFERAAGKCPYAGGNTLRLRLREWEEAGAWEPLRDRLRETLPDGFGLAWERLEPRQGVGKE